MSATTGATRPPQRSYHGNPVIKEPIWKPEIPWYFFTGGLGGGSAALAYLAELGGHEQLARRAWPIALGGIGVSPLLLISDLGVPHRFLNMLRMFKVTSPMSVGSWLLVAGGATTTVAATNALTGRLAGPARLAKPAAALVGLPISTYTAALIAQTAVPAWHGARRELPAIFAAGAAASAGAAATIATPVRHAAPARRVALAGAAAELLSVQAMEQWLGAVGEPYHVEQAGTYARAARALTVGGALLIGAAGARSRVAAAVGGGMVLAGAVCERWSVFKAGLQSARDPKYVVGPQRERVDGGRGHGASRRALDGRVAEGAR
ncbi:NrfD/PsrC family molybdoenzyme membrane anchor subunit [Conexibacter arvalis]|uniref:Formate-dependent nitrite reductase membrane component NrfD n=1 Tax=Conexibacter arvalis TaxID=912552 RepID=A0A840IDS2_9ACTN|nr:NrfD/PsrC family molybdoenzyme membrane anchor subunit [Conexibacter arvalis]MBB4662401.1 formate-dependent nitrite reductase membrane component NrfD [Conexibacter arvalis]